MEQAVSMPNWHIVDPSVPDSHVSARAKLPVLVAICAKPLTVCIMKLIAKSYRYAVCTICPDFLDPPITVLIGPFACQKGFHFGATIVEIRPVAPLRIWRVGHWALGIGLSIDDFGTGHASVAGLIQIDPDKVKIDRCLITLILGSERALNIVQALLGPCALLEIEVVAESVEDIEQANSLLSLGCQYLQGYAFMKPACEKEMRSSLEDRQHRLAS